MPFDLYVTLTPAPPRGGPEPSTTIWDWCGCWPTVWVADVQRVLEGYAKPEAQRWKIVKVRTRRAFKGTLHSAGTYARKERD